MSKKFSHKIVLEHILFDNTIGLPYTIPNYYRYNCSQQTHNFTMKLITISRIYIRHMLIYGIVFEALHKQIVLVCRFSDCCILDLYRYSKISSQVDHSDRLCFLRFSNTWQTRKNNKVKISSNNSFVTEGFNNLENPKQKLLGNSIGIDFNGIT